MSARILGKGEARDAMEEIEDSDKGLDMTTMILMTAMSVLQKRKSWMMMYWYEREFENHIASAGWLDHRKILIS